jgi:hypothetical protein
VHDDDVDDGHDDAMLVPRIIQERGFAFVVELAVPCL